MYVWFGGGGGGGGGGLCVLNGYGKRGKFHRKVQDASKDDTTPHASDCILVSPPSVCPSEIK